MSRIKTLKNNQNDQRYSIILLYAGGNHSLKSGPRALIELNRKMLFEHHIKAIEHRFGAINHNIIAVCGYESTKIMNKLPEHIIKIENENYESTGVARSIGMGLRATNAENVIVIYGDLFFTYEALNFDLDKSCVVIDKVGHMDTTIGCSNNGECVDIMLYGMPYKWCEIAFFRGKELNTLKNICWNENKYKLFGFELINEIVDKGGSFNIYGNDKAKVCDLDCAKHLAKAKELIL
jgi:choline kinase